MDFENQGYRAILKRELRRRIERNPHYSLRSFAKDLTLAPSSLSEILNRKSGMSRVTATKVAKQLGYTEKESSYFCDLVLAEDGRTPDVRRNASDRVGKQWQEKNVAPIAIDQFTLISDWYHFAILEYISMKGNSCGPQDVANDLKLDLPTVHDALERLVRVGQLRCVGPHRFEPMHPAATAGTDVSSRAIKNFHSGILVRANQALQTQAVAEREFITTIMAFSRQRLPEVKTFLRRVHDEFIKEFGKSSDANDVTCLSMEFFSLLKTMLLVGFVSLFVTFGLSAPTRAVAASTWRTVGNGVTPPHNEGATDAPSDLQESAITAARRRAHMDGRSEEHCHLIMLPCLPGNNGNTGMNIMALFRFTTPQSTK